VSKRRTVLIAAGLSLLYFSIQLAYIAHLPLVMDEFDGANEAYQLLEVTPYKDYQPYKTALGYYLQLPPLVLTSDPWTGLTLSKVWLASINTAAIFGTTLALATIFTPAAALTGQLLLISMTTFLERSSEIRVDMLTAWFGLASFLLLLKRRWLLAGVVAGLSFLVSQKGVYYVVSANVAAGVYWLFEARDRRTFRDLVAMNAGVALTIIAYLGLWSLVATPWTVFAATFLRHGDIALANLYSIDHYWASTVSKNPLFYWGALAGVGALVVARWRGAVGATHLMAAVYGASLFALCRWHKQPWPYFFVILIPTLMVVHVAAAELILRSPRARTVMIAVVLVAGVGMPLTYMPGILSRDHAYQRHVVRLASAMLDAHDTYLAGNDLIYNRTQSLAALRRLGALHGEAMRQWPQAQLDALIADIDAARPKLVINDYRMRGLPVPVKRYLATRFAPLWSSIDGYAPLIGVSERDFELWFDGDYLVEPESGSAVIDGATIEAGTRFTLARGRHRNDSGAPLRLRLQPGDFAAHADPKMKRRQMMFARAYDY